MIAFLLAFLLPLPFIIVMILSLFWKDQRLGYFGAAAGIITLVFTFLLWQSNGTNSMPWFTIAGVSIGWGIMLDKLSLLFTAIVAGIGAFIFLYSAGYLEEHEDLRRYYAELSLFAAAMIIAVTASNLFQLFFAWELVGVSSYLLIGFWHDRESAIAAARKAFITIIIGDAFLLGGILLLWKSYGTFEIAPIIAGLHPGALTVAAGVCIIVGAISKAAQFPLHGWLPDAMEGPTPVSAFLHSATMVKLGLYLIARFLPLIALAGLSPVLLFIAVVTIGISAAMALVENDIKRVLAYSTMNQLAFIMLAFSIGATTAGLYHLLNHSIFKALLFMVAGVAIHAAGTQDITKMRLKLGKNLLAIATLLGVLALAGVPPLSGFFSKDAIFDAVIATHNHLLIAFFCAAIVASAAYIFRWYFLIFHIDGNDAHADWRMSVPLPILATLVATGGLLMPAFFAWLGESAHLGVASLLSIALAGAGFLIAYMVYCRKSWGIDRLAASSLAKALRARFLLDDLGMLFAGTIYDIGLALDWIDALVDRFVNGIARFLSRLGAVLRMLITGRTSTYIAAVITGFIIIAIILRFA